MLYCESKKISSAADTMSVFRRVFLQRGVTQDFVYVQRLQQPVEMEKRKL